MARDVESLVLRMSADLRKFEKSMAKADETARKRLNAIEAQALRSQKNLERTMARAGDGMVSALRSSLSDLAPTLAAAFSTTAVIQYADAWTQGRNALAAAGTATEDLSRRQEELVDLANETRSSTEQTISLYRRLSIATQEMGMSQGDALRLTELLNKSFQTSGSSTQEAAAAALQLSQALASGVLQGDELRSIRENAPQLAQAIAKAMGVGIGELKKLGSEGKITAQVVASAILGAGDQIEAKFATTSVTVSQSLQILDNQLGRYIGQQDASLSATQRAAAGIVALANNLDTLLPIIGTLAGLIGTRYVLSLTAAASSQLAAGVSAGRLALFQTAMTASMTGTTRATLLATAATRSFSAALAANPIGAVVVAVAALAAGFGLLAARQREADQRVEDLRSSMNGAREAMDAYEEAAKAATNATADNAQKMKESAEAARLDALYRLENARAIRAQTAALAEQRAREARVADEQANTIGTPYPGMMGGQAVRASQRSIQAQREADAAREAEQAAERRYATITKNMKSGAYKVRTPTPAPSSSKAAKAASGPTPEELAAMRQMLALQGQVELLKAQGRDADAAAIQRQIDILNLTKQYSDAEVANAREAATAQVNAVALAEAAVKGREVAAERTKFWLDAANEAVALQNDQMLDRLGYEAELAGLAGNPDRIKAAERALFIEERINELLRLRPTLTQDEARNQAGREADALDAAGRQGELRDEFRSAFSDGIKAAIDGDLGGFFENMADRFTSRMLDNLADDLFDLLSEAAKGMSGGGGGGWMSAIAGLFAGKRATGGGVVGGQAYITGERRPEVFVPHTSGTIIPSVNAAMNRAQQAKTTSLAPVVRIYMDEGGMFAPRVQQISGAVAVQTTAAGVAYAQDRTQQASRRRRQSFVG